MQCFENRDWQMLSKCKMIMIVSYYSRDTHRRYDSCVGAKADGWGLWNMSDAWDGRVCGPLKLLNLCAWGWMDLCFRRLHTQHAVTYQLLHSISFLPPPHLLLPYAGQGLVATSWLIYFLCSWARCVWTKAQDLITLDFGTTEIRSSLCILQLLLWSFLIWYKMELMEKGPKKKDFSVHFEISNYSSIASAWQTRITMYTQPVEFLRKKICHKLTCFQVSNDQKEFKFEMTLAYRLSDHQFKDINDDAWFSRLKRVTGLSAASNQHFC